MPKKTLHLALIIVAAVVVTGYVVLGDNAPHSMVLVALYAILCAGVMRFNLAHPMCWLLAAIYVYHFSMVFLDFIGYRRLEASQQVVFVAWISLFVSSITIYILSNRTKRIGFIENVGGVKLAAARFMYLFALSIVVVVNVLFLALGFSGKAEASLAGFSVWTSFDRWLLLFYIVILLISVYRRGEFPSLFVVFTLATSLMVALNTGQRELFFGASLATLLIYVERYRPKRTVVIGLLMVLALSIPVLGSAKNILVKDVEINTDGLVVGLLDGEFRSASYNLGVVIANKESWDYFYGETILWSIGRSLVPAFIASVKNSVAWYNESFHPSVVESGRGYGFSFAADGFINFGYPGVAVWFIFLSAFVMLLYNKRGRSIVFMATYFSSVPTFVYVMRADLSNLISPMLKNVALPIILLLFVSEVLQRFKKKRVSVRRYALREGGR